MGIEDFIKDALYKPNDYIAYHFGREWRSCIREGNHRRRHRKSRSFFLNEMDGFAANMGVVVLATTNYPERLDPSIRERPSRFDRKYHFDLPGPAERAQYVALWNEKLQSDLQLSGKGQLDLAEATDGFSFA